MTGPVTTCLPAVRMLHDRLGARQTLEIVHRLSSQNATFRLPGPHAAEGWEDAFDGVDSWRMAGSHLYASTRLAPGVTIGDGMLISPPGSMPIETLTTIAVGKPARFLIDHPVLDDSMTITAVGTSGVMQCWATVDHARIRIDHVLRALAGGTRP